MNSYLIFIGYQDGLYLDAIIDITEDLVTFNANELLRGDDPLNTLEDLKNYVFLRMRLNYHIKAYRIDSDISYDTLKEQLTINDTLLDYIKTNYNPIRI